MTTNKSGTVSYNTAENNLNIAVFELPKYVYRNISVSAVITGSGEQEVAYKADGTTNTGYITNWRYLSNEDKKKVSYESKKQRVKLGDGKGSKTGNEIYKLKKLNKQNPNFKVIPKP